MWRSVHAFTVARPPTAWRWPGAWASACSSAGLLLTRRRVTDPTSGLQAVNRRAIEFLARAYPQDYPEIEARILLHRAGLTAIELQAVMAAARGVSHQPLARRVLHGQSAARRAHHRRQKNPHPAGVSAEATQGRVQGPPKKGGPLYSFVVSCHSRF
ncbi:hypothetical protein [Candidatus Amarolinea dominans]|uniref:hypothetical protein n=1 Tax=Candidatus Amarolinea dominans TaxID=3140696 RepID=UPI0031372B57|nr:hypothetical protein [Anaerolineae bacterium]